MKNLFWIVLFALFFSACTALGGGNGTPTLDVSALDTQKEIGTVVAGTQTAVAEKTLAAPPATPTPGEASVQDLILTSAEVNELANRWSDHPLDDTENIPLEHCTGECISLIWEGGEDSRSDLFITLMSFPSRDEAVNIFNEVKKLSQGDIPLDLSLPELVTLPPETYLFDARSTRSVLGIGTRRSSIVILIGLNLPDLSEEENLLFLSLFADRQIQKLMAAGY